MQQILNDLNTLTDKLNQLDQKIIRLINEQQIEQAIELTTQREKLINIISSLYNKVDNNLTVEYRSLLTTINKKIEIILNNNTLLLELFTMVKEQTKSELAMTFSNHKKLKGYSLGHSNFR